MHSESSAYTSKDNQPLSWLKTGAGFSCRAVRGLDWREKFGFGLERKVADGNPGSLGAE